MPSVISESRQGGAIHSSRGEGIYAPASEQDWEQKAMAVLKTDQMPPNPLEEHETVDIIEETARQHGLRPHEIFNAALPAPESVEEKLFFLPRRCVTERVFSVLETVLLKPAGIHASIPSDISNHMSGFGGLKCWCCREINKLGFGTGQMQSFSRYSGRQDSIENLHTQLDPVRIFEKDLGISQQKLLEIIKSAGVQEDSPPEDPRTQLERLASQIEHQRRNPSGEPRRSKIFSVFSKKRG